MDLDASRPVDDLQIETARRKPADCYRKLGRHRAALEAGAAPTLVAQWSREVQAERAVAEPHLAMIGSQQPTGVRMGASRSATS
jgi:site-specific DNA recombinase